MRWQLRFDEQTLGQELLIEVLTSLLTYRPSSAVLVLQRATRLAHHPENTHNGVVDVAMFVEPYAYDNDRMASRRVDSKPYPVKDN